MAWPTHVTVAILAQGTLRAVAVMQAFSEFARGSSHVGGVLVLGMMCGVCGVPPCVCVCARLSSVVSCFVCGVGGGGGEKKLAAP